MSPAKQQKIIFLSRHVLNRPGYHIVHCVVSRSVPNALLTWSLGCGDVGPETAAQRFDGSCDSAHPASAPWRGYAAPAPDRSYSNWHWGRTWSSASVEISHTIQMQTVLSANHCGVNLQPLSNITVISADTFQMYVADILTLWRVDVSYWITHCDFVRVWQFQFNSLRQNQIL